MYTCVYFLSACHSHSLPHSLFLSLSVFLSLARSISLSLSLSLSLSHSHSVPPFCALSLPLSLSVSLTCALSSLCLIASFFISPSPPNSLFFFFPFHLFFPTNPSQFFLTLSVRIVTFNNYLGNLSTYCSYNQQIKSYDPFLPLLFDA